MERRGMPVLLAVFMLLAVILGATETDATINIRTVNPVNNEVFGGSKTFTIDNTSGLGEFTIHHVEFYFGKSDGTSSLFANISNSTFSGSQLADSLVNYNTTNSTTSSPFVDVQASGLFANITVKVYHSNSSASLNLFMNLTNATSLTINNQAPRFTLQSVSPTTNQFIGGNFLFVIRNTTALTTISIAHVEYYLGLVSGSASLFANVTNSSLAVGSGNNLLNYNTTNDTALSPFSDLRASGNFPNITVVVYSYNTSVNGTGPFKNTTTMTGITVDNSAPQLNLEFKDKDLVFVESPFNFFFGGTVNIDCNPSDVISGVQNVSVLVKQPGAQSFSQVGTALNGEVAFANTEELGEYNVKCQVFDKGIKTNNQTSTFNILKSPPSSTIGSGFGGGLPSGFVSPVGKKKVVAGSINDAGTLASESTSRLIQMGGVVVLLVKGESHKFEVVEVTDEQAVISITSRPTEVTVAAGNTEEVDLDDDGTNDVAVTFHKRFPEGGKYADITFALSESPAAPAVEEDADTQPTPTTQPDQTVRTSNAGLWITLIVIVIIVIIGYTMIKGKKR